MGDTALTSAHSIGLIVEMEEYFVLFHPMVHSVHSSLDVHEDGMTSNRGIEDAHCPPRFLEEFLMFRISRIN